MNPEAIVKNVPRMFFNSFYINLKHRVDRRAHMEAELDRVNIVADRFEAYNTNKDLVHSDKPYFLDPRFEEMIHRTPGAVGCYLSQVACMRAVLNRPQRPNVLIMEDDLVFCDDFWDRLRVFEMAMPELDPTWDVFWLGGTFHSGKVGVWHKPGPDFELTKYARIIRTFGAWSTYAYIVRHDSIKKVLDLLDVNLEGSWGIDHNFITLGDRISSYCFVPGCVKQMDGASDIGSGQTLFSGFQSLGPYWWQPKMSDFHPRDFDWEAQR